jgi:neutral trehalase
MKINTIQIKQALALLLVLAMLSSMLASCKHNDNSGAENTNSDIATDGNDNSTNPATDNINTNQDNIIPVFTNGEYRVKIIRGDLATTLEKNVYNQIRNLFKSQTGSRPNLETDFWENGEEFYDGPAILIGKTKYEESESVYQNLGYSKASATLVGDKYVIAITSEDAAEKLISAIKVQLQQNEKNNIVINSNWEITVKDAKMTKTEWLEQYKKELSERDLALLKRAYEVIEGNTLQGDDMPWGSSPAISPWSGSTAGLWNWDSVFHAMTVARYDGELAKSCIDNFAMFQCENGLLPDVIYADGNIMDNYSKPPVFAWGVLEVYKATDDVEFLKRNYERASKNEAFWRSDRFDNGLFFYSAQENPEKDDYLHPRWESGWDNSPRWDIAPITDLYAIDLNCYMVLTYRSLAEMAEILGEDNSEWISKEKALAKEIETRLYNKDIGAYVDRNRKTGEYSTVLSPASFMPLFIGTASQERAESMNKIARDTKKFYPGMPSVSYDDKGYDNNYWRGPTWLNIAFFAIKGLDDYGYTDTASEMKEFILNMCYEGLPYIYENYDSIKETGKSHNLFSWSSAFIIEFILQMKDEKK